MNAPSTDLRPEVTEFIASVRARLADLTEEERDELLEGLAADLSEELAEGGTLPDPAAYADELRAAAGLPAAKRLRLRRSRTLKQLCVEAPNDLRDRWFALVRSDDRALKAWTLVEGMRPAWWVLRAWVAVTWLDVAVGSWEQVTVLPTLAVPLLGPALFAAASIVSVLIGQGKLWPGSGPDRTAGARWLLAGLNLLAVVVPFTFVYPTTQPSYVVTYGHAVAVDHGPPVLRRGPDVVRNIYAFDADGKPLQGVQLFDQQGRPIAVAAESSMGEGAERQVTCPWFNGTTALFNVFPLPQRTQRHGTCLGHPDPAKVGPQGFHEPPLASVPPATLPAVPQG